MMLAQRILDTLRAHGPIGRAELANWFRDADNIDFDTTLTRLMRQNSVSFELGKYDLVAQRPGTAGKPFIAMASVGPVGQLGCNRDAVPTASEGVAASLMPPATRDRFECPLCHNLRFDAEFRHSKLGNRYINCKHCEAQKTQETRQKRFAATINGTDHAAGQGVEVAREAGSLQAQDKGETTPESRAPVSCESRNQSDSPATESTEKRGNNRDVSAERCCAVASVPETSGSYSRSDPREDVRTPAGDSIAFPRSDTTAGPTDPFLAKLMRRRARLLVERQAIDAVLAELERVEGVYRGLMGEGE